MLGQTTTLSLVFSILAAAPALINAHGQVDWIGCNGQQYDAWDLDDHYKAAYEKQGESLLPNRVFEKRSMLTRLLFWQTRSTVNSLVKSLA
jgi:hypothetical protein